MRKEESKLLGEILKKSHIDLVLFGIDVDQLAEGECILTYEEGKYVLKDNPTTHLLSMNLKEELQGSKLNVHVQIVIF